ncbi:unnamed protein product [Mytilus edulis]|uniref:C1q domain-containing protein n=1 Tax=Mytilus edulis TaxID=6550 RepID=A0A8S3SY03_MYTED|nr:unnamed protein product [Mytilus edulis]
MHELIEAEQKRESVLESMQFTLDQEKTRFNHSIGLILENLTIQSNMTWQEFILKQQTVVLTGCSVGSAKVSTGTLRFPDIKTSIGVSDLSSFKSTGKFTCHVPGYYYITVTTMSLKNQPRIEFMRNSTAIHWQYMTSYIKNSIYWIPGAAALALELKMNDTVWINIVYRNNIYQSCLTIFKIN